MRSALMFATLLLFAIVPFSNTAAEDHQEEDPPKFPMYLLQEQEEAARCTQCVQPGQALRAGARLRRQGPVQGLQVHRVWQRMGQLRTKGQTVSRSASKAAIAQW